MYLCFKDRAVLQVFRAVKIMSLCIIYYGFRKQPSRIDRRKKRFKDGGYDSDSLALWETENSKKF
jgi:hypothetical protein